MTRDEIIEQIDIRDGDDVWVMIVRDNKDSKIPGAKHIVRTCIGIPSYMLYCWLDFSIRDIGEQIIGKINPEVVNVSRKIVIDDSADEV
jgi:hypothetical protein